MAEPAQDASTIETVEEVNARHKKEVKALDGTGRKLLKQANKNKAKMAEAEKKIIKMEHDTKVRHREELLAAAEARTGDTNTKTEAAGGDVEGAGGEASGTSGGAAAGDVEEGISAISIEEKESKIRDQKRAKAQRKREKQREKELERERRIEKEKEEGGPDPRIVEMEALEAQVAPRGFHIREIKADGHCLYRAVAEQLCLTGRNSALTEESYSLMRDEAARELRLSPADYLPFIDEVEEGEEFDRYCEKVQGSAEWGGQVELQALSNALRAPMEVFSAMSPPLLVGESYGGTPLRLTYHEHYYALGAHYNSVVLS